MEKTAEISFNAAQDHSSSLKDFSNDQNFGGAQLSEVTFNSTDAYNKQSMQAAERDFHSQPPES